MPSHIPTGGIQTSGCAVTVLSQNIASGFVARETAYVKLKAEKGIFEKVTIKKVIVDTQEDSIVYVDTFNSVWIEGELVTHSEAISIASTYQTNLAAQIQEYLESLCPPNDAG